jgi:hypothetical protein
MQHLLQLDSGVGADCRPTPTPVVHWRSSTLRPSPDTRRLGASQGCQAGGPRTRRQTPVSEVAKGRNTNVRQNRRQNRQAKAGWQAWSKRTRSRGPRTRLSVGCTPLTRRIARPYGYAKPLSGTVKPHAGSQECRSTLEQGVPRKPARGRDGSRSQGLGESPRIC